MSSAHAASPTSTDAHLNFRNTLSAQQARSSACSLSGTWKAPFGSFTGVLPGAPSARARSNSAMAGGTVSASRPKPCSSPHMSVTRLATDNALPGLCF